MSEHDNLKDAFANASPNKKGALGILIGLGTMLSSAITNETEYSPAIGGAITILSLGYIFYHWQKSGKRNVSDIDDDTPSNDDMHLNNDWNHRKDEAQQRNKETI